MKKLIVMMFGAAIGLAAQAATVNWAFTWATDANGNDLDKATAYLMNVDTMTVAAAQSALTAKTFDASKALDSATTSNSGNGAEVSKTSSVDLTGAQQFYVVLVDGGNYGITDTVPVTMNSIGTTTVNFQELSDESGNSTLPVAWSPGGVAGGGGQGDNPAPEPTSGLLLLVGGALLGLRRKRA